MLSHATASSGPITLEEAEQAHTYKVFNLKAVQWQSNYLIKLFKVSQTAQ